MGKLAFRQIKPITLKVVGVIIAVLIFSIGAYTGANAVFGRSAWRGYFSDIYDGYGTYVLPVISGGQALPSSSINSPSDLITLLKDYNQTGNAQEVTGSAYIVNTMLGRSAPGLGKDISAADWAELSNRMDALQTAGLIRWDGNVIGTENSYYQGTYRGPNPADVAYDYNGRDETGITFLNSDGSVAYQLIRRCSNPLGDLSGLQVVQIANKWSLSAASTPYVNGVAVSSAKPVDTIQWVNTVNNDGPNATNQDVYSNVALSGFTNGWTSPVAGDFASSQGPGIIRTIVPYAQYTVTQNDVGNTLCEQVQFDPANSDGTRNGRGNDSCVSVPYNYTLTPSVTTDHSGVIEPSTSLNVTPTVNNTGPTKSQSTQWQVTQIVVAPGQAVPNAAGGTSPAAITPCGTYFRALPNATCSTINSGTSVFDTNGNVLSGNPLTMSPVVVGDLAVGTKICFAFSVQPSSNSSDTWTHSAPTCLIIGKKPKLQILGGDLISGGSVNTSTTNKNIGGTNYTFGSWIEYGIFAVGTITGAGSGSAYAGTGMPTTTFCNASLLSFTNAGSSTCLPTTTIGNYISASPMPDVASSFPATGAPTIGGGDLADQAKTGIFTSGNVTLTGGTIQKGRWLVINALTADITIDGNIVYFPGVMQSISDIPQVVIIANNINITAKVTQVDAWLIAKGSLNTCSDVAGNLSATLCSQSLVVNGPVMAGKMILRRTAGSGTGANSGDPAEVFNLRPDAYLWASARATGSGRIQTAYTTELPPRL